MKSEKEELEKKFIALKDRLQNTEHTQEKFRIQNFALNDMVSSSNRQITDLQNRVNLLETEVTLVCIVMLDHLGNDKHKFVIIISLY